MRDAPSRTLIEALWEAGATVVAYDPEAMHEARRLYPVEMSDGRLRLAEDENDALNHSHCLVICTEWRPFRAPDFEEVRERLLYPVIFDGRNIHDPERMEREGFTYFGIGLGQLPEPAMVGAAG